jgi:hypothetical protein
MHHAVGGYLLLFSSGYQHTVGYSYDYSILYIVLLCINFMIKKPNILPGPDEKSSE